MHQLKLFLKEVSVRELEPYDFHNLDEVFGIEIGCNMNRGKFVFDTKV